MKFIIHVCAIIALTKVCEDNGSMFRKTSIIEHEVILYLDDPCWSYYKRKYFPWSDRDACSEYYQRSFMQAVDSVSKCRSEAHRTKRQAGVAADVLTVAVTDLVSSAVVQRGAQITAETAIALFYEQQNIPLLLWNFGKKLITACHEFALAGPNNSTIDATIAKTKSLCKLYGEIGANTDNLLIIERERIDGYIAMPQLIELTGD